LRVLFDTHGFLWAVSDDSHLSSTARRIFTDPANEILLSVASIWEILVKAEAGRLPLPRPSASYIQSQLLKTSTEVLPILLRHVLQIANLPPHHRDPFDRIILAQAVEEKIPVVSADTKFRAYPVEVLW
jgi:PIN domain nuclease of toxin-antitoxin system